MSRYAERTEVTSDRSRAEIERTLTRYGADQFLYAWQEGAAVIGFRMRGRMIRFLLPMPDRDDEEFRYTAVRRYERSREEAAAVWEQACRQRWRALALVIRAKLEAVEAGIVTLEQEFLAQIVLPDNSTVGDWVGPQVAQAYEVGRMPALLPWSGERPRG
jgi:hypothetical protein